MVIKMKISFKLENLVHYLLIILLYYTTGGAFSYTNYSLKITFLFFVALLFCIILNKHTFLRENALSAFICMSLFLIIIPLIFNDSIFSYIAIIMQLAIGAFCASIIPFREFIRKYINVIVFFALVSLVGFVIGFIIPSIAFSFPLTVGEASVDYYNAGVYVFMSAKGFGEFTLTTRNAGICWEPGCYQCFLNIGLLFLLERKKYEARKYFYFKFCILVITILTTISTTGIMIMLLLLIFYYREWLLDLNYKSYIMIFLLICSCLFLFFNTNLGNDFLEKITREFSGESTFLDRISLSKIHYIVSENGIPYLLGMSFSKWLTYNESMWNSIIHSILCLGLPFTIIQLIGYWKGAHVLSKKWWLLFLIMILSASTETLFWRVFFNTFAFYGWIYYRGQILVDNY